MSSFHRLLFISLIALYCPGCIHTKDSGEHLAKTYCGSCHVYPDPTLLDRKTWQDHVLPQMRFRMGLDLTPLWTLPADEIDVITRMIPRPMLKEEEWKKIEQFYLKNAPAEIGYPPKIQHHSVPLCPIESPELPIPALVKLLEHDSENRRTIVGTRTAQMYILDETFSEDRSIRLASPPSDVMAITSDSLHILEMGKMDPNALSIGKVVATNLRSGETAILIDSLNRPVHFEHSDFDADGDTDILISCFGNFAGSLSLFERTNNGFVRHELHRLPGNRRTVLRDVNNDGLPDIVALATQGDEQLLLFFNEGKMRFSNRRLYRFPPVFGSSFFELKDMDGDGDEDIVYVNGDNSDFSTILKPYHGIRILANDGKFNFFEKAFLPLHGAYQSAALDFDRDGDIDIAAISYFNDFMNTPKRSFVYYENTGTDFIPNTSPLTNVGRWIVMESWDANNDGYPDLMLGALNFNIGVDAQTISQWKEKNIPILVLRNVGRTGKVISSGVLE